MKQIKVIDNILVRFSKYYPIINVNFLKKKKNSLTGPSTFVFLIVTDRSRIKVSQVVKIVKLLTRQKRDRYIFDIDASEIE